MRCDKKKDQSVLSEYQDRTFMKIIIKVWPPEISAITEVDWVPKRDHRIIKFGGFSEIANGQFLPMIINFQEMLIPFLRF